MSTSEHTCWVRIGTRIDLCYGELIGTDDSHRNWNDYPCIYCGAPICVRDWWWHVPNSLLPSRLLEMNYEYGWCSECVRLFRIRPRDVPREQWLRELRLLYGDETLEQLGVIATK